MRAYWRNLVITDYQQAFSVESSYVHGLYGRSLLSAPRTLLGWQAFELGRERRPGIIDCLADAYSHFSRSVTAKLLTPAGVEDLTCRYEQSISCLVARLEHELRTIEDAHELERRLLPVMTFHVLNWMMPTDTVLELLRAIFQVDATAQSYFLALIDNGRSHLLADVRHDNAILLAHTAADDRRAEALALTLIAARSAGLHEQLDTIRAIPLAWNLAMREEEERKVEQARALHCLQPYQQELS